jgi:hypothetical protein
MSLADFEDIFQICKHWDDVKVHGEGKKLKQDLSSGDLDSRTSRWWESLEEEILFKKNERESVHT